MKNILLIAICMIVISGCANRGGLHQYSLQDWTSMVRAHNKEYLDRRFGESNQNTPRDYSGIAPSQPTQYYIDQYRPTRQINPMPSRHSYHIGNKHYICHTYGMSDITYCN